MRRLAAVLTLAAALLAAPGALAQEPADRTLGVQGLGELELAPDVGEFEAEVVRTSPTSRGARDLANRRLNAIVSRLRALDVPRQDITTTSIALFRERIRTPRTKALRVRYTATGAFAVRVEDTARVGRALDAVAGAGATSIEGPEFSFSQAKRTEGRLGAEKAALADARRRADEAAASQGQRVVGVRSIELDPGSAREPSAEDEEGAGPALSAPARGGPSVAPTPVLPGRETFSSAVRVVYLLQPAG
jgi:uncharacterized protein YggE